MEDMSRRGFLAKTGTGLAAAGMLAAAPVSFLKEPKLSIPKSTEVEPTSESVSTSTDTLVVHIPNPRSGEIRYMMGTQEVVRHDRALVSRILHGAKKSGR